jgi:hypothetical protein
MDANPADDDFRIARHPHKIQRPIWALPPRERLPQAPDGEAATSEEAQQQAEPEDGTEA